MCVTSDLLHVRRFVLLSIYWIFDRDCLAAPRVLRHEIQGVAQNLLLQITHAGPAQAVPYFKSFRIERARRTHLRRHFRTDGDENRRDPFHFDFALDRDDRAVTDARSTTREHDRISARTFVDLVGDFRRRAFVHCFQLHRVTHVADVFFSDAPDEAL